MRHPRILAPFAAALLSVLPSVLAGHPHVWIETRLGLILDEQGRLSAVEVIWAYDPDTSDILLEDRGYALRSDGTLAGEDLADFAGTDVNWDADGFEGDLYLSHDGGPLALGPPEGHSADYIDERFVTRHLRPLLRPVDAAAAPVELKVYDPTFWAIYTMDGGVALDGTAPCTVTITPPDMEAANARLMALLSEIPEGPLVEVNFPPVGEFYADTITLSCGPAGEAQDS